MDTVTMDSDNSVLNYSIDPTCTLVPTTALADDRPDEHIALLDQRLIIARCSLWWTDTPQLEDQATGLIGHFACRDKKAGQTLLFEACRRLAFSGARQQAIAPINGNTWKSYRLVTESNGAPPFFLEPVPNPVCLEAVLEAGFLPLAQYSSVINHNVDITDPGLDAAGTALRESGFELRGLKGDAFDSELALLHELCLRAFADNFLYTPISFSEFSSLYAPIRELMHPELVLLLMRGDRLAGFIFSLPDLNQAKKGGTPDTLIIKTLAVDPDFRCRNIGNWLVKCIYDMAKTLGFKKVIHALMLDNNISRTMLSQHAEVLRRYTLYSLPLSESS